MGEALDISAVTGAWVRMLQARERPTPGAWWAEREPELRRLGGEAGEIEVCSEQRRGLARDQAALLVDRLLAPVARGRGALDLAIGEGLATLSVGDRTLRLGYCSIGDYAREKLGIAARTAQAMAQLSRELRERPLLREAVLRGEVSARKAQALVGVVFGENEAQWVERARAETVRALEQAVRAERGEEESDEAWERVCLPLSGEERAELDEALRLAGKVVGTMPPRHQRLEALSQEFLSEYPDPEGGEGSAEAVGAADGEAGGTGRGAAGDEAAPVADGEAGSKGCQGEGRGLPPGRDEGLHEAEADATSAAARWSPPPGRGLPSWPVQDWLEAAKEALEGETQRWEALGVLDPVVAPRAGEEADPRVLDEELRRLMAMRRRWDEMLGHLGLVMKSFGLWREAGFASFDHYCLERLWMASRTVEQRAWLERRCYHLPGLREAMRSGRLSYEQARLLAGHAAPETLEEWVRKAEGMSCLALRRALDEGEQRQMCAREELELLVPARVADLLAAAFRAAEKKAGRHLTPGECLLQMASHFTSVWQGVVHQPSTPQRRARRRDEHCQVPGCSRMAAHAHHILPLSRGGGDHPSNLVGLCAAHHLHGVHRGWVRVQGRAPDQLIWELGERVPGAGQDGLFA